MEKILMKPGTPYSGTCFDLHGKTALVSGGAGLLGLEFSKALYSAGANVVIADVNKDLLEPARESVRKISPAGKAETCVLDVTDRKSISQCAGYAVRKFGSVDVLVNSAAIDPKYDKSQDTSKNSKFTEFPESMWQLSISVNLTGAFLLTQEVCKVMEKKGSGSIINIGSNYGLVGPDQRIYRKKGQRNQTYKPAVYSVCKAGLIGFTKFLAAYYAGTKIRVNMLTPSGVYNNHDQEFKQNYSERTVLRRMSRKDEYGGAVVFLASEASSYMTGSNLVMDGGWTAL
jgi:2-deoxy-D-gluconate 3-dehydrogenase